MRIFEYISLGLRYRSDPFFTKYIKHRNVLDIGCGRGEFLSRDPAKFIGVDIDPTLVKMSTDNGLKAYCMSAFALKFPDSSFDVIHASQIIEHFSPTEASRFLEEAARLLRPNGIVYITTPGVRNVWNTFSHIRPYPPAAFQKLLGSDTENYIRKNKVNLVLEDSWGFRFFSKHKSMMFMLSTVDLFFKAKNPISWTIVLRKIRSDI